MLKKPPFVSLVYMPDKLFTFLLAMCLAVVMSACAQPKKTSSKKQSLHAAVLEARRQRLVSAMPGAQPINNYRILVIWQSTKAPQSFFWRGEDGWINCLVNEVHKRQGVVNKEMEELWYTAAEIAPEKIKKNDTLELIPMPGGRFATPAEIPAQARNTLFFQLLNDTKWQALPVHKFKQLKDMQGP